ncbi:uncharacterized protein LOC124556158 [Schistocerca americana]|uniref:uncharacterized protein LOC124556158 n=1 Tax=Schistocerca americana TaxID=7009 RepID=UPI001F500113|nr:uncharacterized protein LOC124556158 [Schistocerca americana]
MEFFPFLISILVSTAVLKEPTTDPRNFTHVVPEHELSDRQYYNGPDFSQAPTGSLKVDNAALSDDMDDLTKLYDELDLTKENTHLESTNTLQSGMDTKEHFQQYTAETSAAEMEYLEQWYDEFSVATGQVLQQQQLETESPHGVEELVLASFAAIEQQLTDFELQLLES